MEKQIITAPIQTGGEAREMSDRGIQAWYELKIAGLFNPACGAPKMEVDVRRPAG